jgi:hypothetical protein
MDLKFLKYLNFKDNTSNNWSLFYNVKLNEYCEMNIFYSNKNYLQNVKFMKNSYASFKVNIVLNSNFNNVLLSFFPAQKIFNRKFGFKNYNILNKYFINDEDESKNDTKPELLNIKNNEKLNEYIYNSFDLEINFPIFGLDRRRFLNLQTLKYNQKYNSLNFFIKPYGDELLYLNKKIDWLSKRKMEYINRNGSKKHKHILPSYLFSIISITKVSDNITSIDSVFCNFYLKN